jgi:hypothetical protein
MKWCNFCLKQLHEDIIDHLYFKCIKLYSYGWLNFCEETFKKLNKNNLIYFKKHKRRAYLPLQSSNLEFGIYILKKIINLNN